MGKIKRYAFLFCGIISGLSAIIWIMIPSFASFFTSIISLAMGVELFSTG